MSSVAWNGLIWVIAGNANNGPGSSYATSGVVMYSYNGISWSITNAGELLPFTTGQIYTVAWNGSTWIVGGQLSGGNPRFLYSVDGITWALQTTPLTGNPNCIATRRQLPYTSVLNMPYVPTYPTIWASTVPATIGKAIDRISALLSTINTANIP